MALRLIAALVAAGLSFGPAAANAEEPSEALPADLYQLLEDAKWLKEQGMVQKAKEKLAEYDRRVEAWRASRDETLALSQEWMMEVVEWARHVPVSQALDAAEKDFNEDRHQEGAFRIIALKDRLMTGTELGRAKCLFGKVSAARSEDMKQMAIEVGGPCELGSRFWKVLLSEDRPARPRTVAAVEDPVVATVETKVTESNDTWQRWAWKSMVQNRSAVAREFNLEVQWVDTDGFVIETDHEYGVRLAAGESRTISGQQLISQPAAKRVVRAQGLVRLSE